MVNPVRQHDVFWGWSKFGGHWVILLSPIIQSKLVVIWGCGELFYWLLNWSFESLNNSSRLVFYICVCVLSCFSRVQLCVTLWTVSCQAPLSIGFSRQEYWSGLPCPTSGDLPNPGIKPVSLMSPGLATGFFTSSAIWEALWAHIYIYVCVCVCVCVCVWVCVCMYIGSNSCFLNLIPGFFLWTYSSVES